MDDVRVVEPRGRARLAPEALEELGILGVAGADDLERDDAVERGLASLVHGSHPALTDWLDGCIAQFVVVCRKVRTERPESFVLASPEVVERAHRGGRDAKPTYWLETRAYESDEFRERWDKIGRGF